jgi:hypothetical protein
MTRRLARLLLTVALVAAACSSPAPTSTTAAPVPNAAPAIEGADGPIPLIVDYSPTVSDVGALLYLLSHPNVDVLAITLPVTGEAGCELGAEVTLGILSMFEREDIPVACDPELPAEAREWPAEFLTGHQALPFGLPDPVSVPDPRPAHQLITDIVGVVAAGEDLVTAEDVNLLVVGDGSTVRDPAGVPVAVATGVSDPAGFYAHFLSTISGGA